MAKSIGTLTASLVLDSKGFLSGFQKSTAAAKSFASTMKTSVAAGFKSAVASLSMFTKAMQLAKKAFFSLASDFAKMAESNGTMYATKVAFQNLVAQLNEIKLMSFTAIAEPLTAGFEKASAALQEFRDGLAALGFEMQDLTNFARYSISNIMTLLEVPIKAIEALIAGYMTLQHTMIGNMDEAHRALSTFGEQVDDFGRAMKNAFSSVALGDTSGLGFAKTPFVTPPVPAVAPSSAAVKAAEPTRLSPLERGTQAAAEAIMRMKGGTGNTMSREGVATIEQLKKIEANTRKRGAVIKEGRI